MTKRIWTFAGLAAAGAASLNTVHGEAGMAPQQQVKRWTAAISLRGFYDDNINTVFSSGGAGAKESSGGFEVRPSVGVSFPSAQTFFGANYEYGLKYYFDREPKDDQSHDFNASLDHAFSERYRLQVNESFLISQEPEVLGEVGAPTRLPQRPDFTGTRNRARLSFNALLTPTFGLALGYENLVYSYEEEGVASRSALLDRMEQFISLDARFQLSTPLVALVGYQLGLIGYTGDDPIFLFGPTGEFRDNTSHFLYAGGEYKLSSTFSSGLRLGAQYTSYSDPDTEDSLSPYVDGDLTYTYEPGSYVQFLIRHTRNATDIAGVAGAVTLDQETTSFVLKLEHRITSKLTGGLLGQLQSSTYNGGSLDGDKDNMFIAGINFEYRFTEHFSAETGYNYDKLNSDVPDRSFVRNRVFLGVRVTY